MIVFSWTLQKNFANMHIVSKRAAAELSLVSKQTNRPLRGKLSPNLCNALMRYGLLFFAKTI